MYNNSSSCKRPGHSINLEEIEMKRSLLFFAMTLSLMISLFGAVFSPVAAAAGGGKSISLVDAQYITGKGVVFTFNVTGDFKQGFGGSVKIGGVSFNLTDCKMKDDGTLACVGAQGLAQFVGQVANVTINGFSSSGFIRTAKNCYFVYDYDKNFIWGALGKHCQDKNPSIGDWILFPNPAFGDNLPHYYLPDGVTCYHNGKGYYYPACPLQ